MSLYQTLDVFMSLSKCLVLLRHISNPIQCHIVSLVSGGVQLSFRGIGAISMWSQYIFSWRLLQLLALSTWIQCMMWLRAMHLFEYLFLYISTLSIVSLCLFQCDIPSLAPVACAVGLYSVWGIDCTNCSSGYYAPATGATACLLCSAGSSCTASLKTACPAGVF